MNIFSSEIRKIVSIRATWVYAAIIAIGMAAGAILSAYVQGMDTPFDASAVTVAGDLAMLVIIFAVANTIGADMTRGTQAWSFLHTNRRAGVVAASSFISSAFFLLAGVVGMLAAWLGVTALGGHVDLSSWTPIYIVLARWGVFAPLAALLAYVLRSGTFSAMVLLADVFVFEIMLGLASADWVRRLTELLPMGNASVLGSGSFPGIDHDRGTAALILAITIGITFAGAAIIVDRRSVK